jgi:hypothetical protein
VVLSDLGLDEVRATFGPIRRHVVLERKLRAQPREGRPLPEQADATVTVVEPA